MFKNQKIFIDKWVYWTKRNVNKKIIKYKVCWCVRKFEQIKNFDYYEFFLIVIKFINYRIIIIIIIAINNWNIEQMNIKIVFFYEKINEKIYVKNFYNYIDNWKIYCRFRKTFYEFKQLFWI